ncbi:MAG: 3-oxoacyl-[acyl-carrier-protein] synthase III C-terminal domain-containing protein, partial [Oscillospiraceae bacterium]
KLFTCHLGGDASGVSKLFGRGVPPSNPFMENPFDRMSDGFAPSNGNSLYMDGRDVYKFATKVMPQAVIKACEKAGITPEELALIVPHQANIRIVETAAKNLKLPMESFFVNIQKYGNMSSACIPIGLDEAVKMGKIKSGDKICVVGFGAGLTYGAAIIEW